MSIEKKEEECLICCDVVSAKQVSNLFCGHFICPECNVKQERKNAQWCVVMQHATSSQHIIFEEI
jgi:hypothetical protein